MANNKQIHKEDRYFRCPNRGDEHGINQADDHDNDDVRD